MFYTYIFIKNIYRCSEFLNTFDNTDLEEGSKIFIWLTDKSEPTQNNKKYMKTPDGRIVKRIINRVVRYIYVCVCACVYVCVSVLG